MPIPAIVVGAAKAYSAYKTVKGAADSASKLIAATKGASQVLSQVKTAIGTFDGGITSRSGGGAKGPEVDMPKLAGLFPKKPGDAALGMRPEENSFFHGLIANMIGYTSNGETEGPQHSKTPDGPGR